MLHLDKSPLTKSSPSGERIKERGRALTNLNAFVLILGT
jgi:hypothetical protein